MPVDQPNPMFETLLSIWKDKTQNLIKIYNKYGKIYL